MFENLMNALKLLANEQMGGDSLVEVPVMGLQERKQIEDAGERSEKVHRCGQSRGGETLAT